MMRRWISEVPSKIVKILEGVGRVIGIPARPPISPADGGTAALSGAAHGFRPHSLRYALPGCFTPRRYPALIAMSPEPE
jgi:hypothetical protein